MVFRDLRDHFDSLLLCHREDSLTYNTDEQIPRYNRDYIYLSGNALSSYIGNLPILALLAHYHVFKPSPFQQAYRFPYA